MNDVNLMRAVTDESLEKVRELISLGANVNTMNDEELTPLLLSVGQESTEITQELIVAGADVNVEYRDPENSTLIVTPLFVAVDVGCLTTVQALLKAGANPNKPVASDSGLTLLFIAAENGDTAIVQALINAGADVNCVVRDEESKNPAAGVTLLMAAVAAHRADIVELLLAAGADTTVKNENGLTALDIALLMEDPIVIELLQKHVAK